MARTNLTTVLALSLSMSLGLAAAPALASGPDLGTATTGLSGATVLGSVDDDWSEAQTQAALQRIRELMPADTARATVLDDAMGVDRQQRDLMIERAIDGDQYQCADTELGLWLDDQLADWDFIDLLILSLTGALDWPSYEALVFQPQGPQVYGENGEYTKELTKTFSRLQGFWDVDGRDIQLAAMHGDVIMDDSRMLPMLTYVYGMSETEAQEILDLVQDYLQQPKFRNGDHPIFTFNAFAYTEQGAPAEQQLGIQDKIVMGDGVLEGMAAIGLGDVAPRGILAHEYGHHVQFELGLFDDHAGDAEATRRTELEADAFGGYYLSHPRGERLRNQRVQAFVRAYGEVGDCSFDNPNHHGTPNQRAAAAAWADQLANAKGAQGHILPARTVSDLFRAALPQILAPDA